MANITICKVGAGEKTVDSKSIQIPDLWHAHQALKDAGDKHNAEMVLESWYLLHAFKDHVNSADAQS